MEKFSMLDFIMSHASSDVDEVIKDSCATARENSHRWRISALPQIENAIANLVLSCDNYRGRLGWPSPGVLFLGGLDAFVSGFKRLSRIPRPQKWCRPQIQLMSETVSASFLFTYLSLTWSVRVGEGSDWLSAEMLNVRWAAMRDEGPKDLIRVMRRFKRPFPRALGGMALVRAVS